VLSLAILVLALTGCRGGTSTSAPRRASTPSSTIDFPSGNTFVEPNHELTAARARYRQVVKKDPGNKYGWYNLGVIAQYEGHRAPATADYLKALDLDPRFEPVLYNLGVLRYRACDWTGAISYLERAVAVNDKDANAHWQLGLALAHGHGGDHHRSTRQLNEAIRLNPNLGNQLGPDVRRRDVNSIPCLRGN